MKRKKRIMQIQHVLVNCFHCFHQQHCSVAGTLPSSVLFGEAFLHISWTILLKDTYLKLACSLNLEMAIKIMKIKEQVTEFPQGLY